jgi:MFS family permease
MVVASPPEAGAQEVFRDGEEVLVAAAAPPYPPLAKAWWAVIIFFLSSLLLGLDRGILTLVVDPIRHDLGISEVQIGLLQGLSFSILYAVAAIPVGLATDKLPRRLVLGVGLFTWTFATMLGGFTHNFAQLFTTRIFVGLGEATLGPCALSLISDLFPPARRGRPLGVYIMGQSLAAGLSIMLTSWVIGAVPAGKLDFLGFAHTAPWRAVFIIAGALGFIVLALLFSFGEPVRRGIALKLKSGIDVAGMARYLGRNWGVFVPFYLGFAIWSAASYGTAAWFATFLLRSFHLHAQDVGPWWGGATSLIGLTGPTLAGFLVDRMSKTGLKTGNFILLIVLPLPTAIATAFAFSSNPVLAVILSLVVTLSAPMVGVTTLAVAQQTMPSNMRGLSVSLFVIFNTIIGATGGPLLMAMATEMLFKDPLKVGYSIVLVDVPACLIASMVFFIGWVNLKRALGRPGDMASLIDDNQSSAIAA